MRSARRAGEGLRGPGCRCRRCSRRAKITSWRPSKLAEVLTHESEQAARGHGGHQHDAHRGRLRSLAFTDTVPQLRQREPSSDSAIGPGEHLRIPARPSPRHDSAEPRRQLHVHISAPEARSRRSAPRSFGFRKASRQSFNCREKLDIVARHRIIRIVMESPLQPQRAPSSP